MKYEAILLLVVMKDRKDIEMEIAIVLGEFCVFVLGQRWG